MNNSKKKRKGTPMSDELKSHVNEIIKEIFKNGDMTEKGNIDNTEEQNKDSDELNEEIKKLTKKIEELTRRNDELEKEIQRSKTEQFSLNIRSMIVEHRMKKMIKVT